MTTPGRRSRRASAAPALPESPETIERREAVVPPGPSSEAVAEEDDLEAFDFDYKPMPPKRSFSFVAEIRCLGRGQPLPYTFGDEHGDEIE